MCNTEYSVLSLWTYQYLQLLIVINLLCNQGALVYSFVYKIICLNLRVGFQASSTGNRKSSCTQFRALITSSHMCRNQMCLADCGDTVNSTAPTTPTLVLGGLGCQVAAALVCAAKAQYMEQSRC